MRTFVIAKQIEAKDAKDALKREANAQIIGCVPATPHALEQFSAAIGTAVSPPSDSEDELGFRRRKKRS